MCTNKTQWLKCFLSLVEFENTICVQSEYFDTENNRKVSQHCTVFDNNFANAAFYYVTVCILCREWL